MEYQNQALATELAMTADCLEQYAGFVDVDSK